MSAKGIWLFLGLGAAVLITGPQQSGAQHVDFNNAVLVPYVTDGDVLVRFSQGVPVTGTNIVAQLYYGPSATSLVAHTAAPARFRVPTTQLPGTWIGSLRTMPGVSVGSVIVMAVRVWDINTGPTFEQASSRLDCGPFYYEVKPEGLAPTNYYMFEFRSVREPVYNFLPLFQTQPQSQVINSGDTLTLSPTVLNASLYQWRFNGQIVGFRPTLVISNAQASHSGSYELIAGNYSGSVTSQTAVISVEPPPQWGEVNFANHVLWPFLSVSFLGVPVVGTNIFAQLFYGTNDQNLVAVTNAPATFRQSTTSLPGTWIGGMRTLVGIPPGTPVRLAVHIWDGSWPYEEAASNHYVVRLPTFSYTPPLPGSSPDAYYMHNFMVPGLYGDCSFPPLGTAILEQPSDRVVSVGDTVILSVVATNYCPSFTQWQFNGTNLVTGFFQSTKLRINNVQPGHQGDYRIIVRGGSGSRTSQVARLTVEPPPQWGEVNFASHVLPVPPDRLLRYGDGQPILGTNVFAQLYYGTNEQQLVAVTNPPATFRHTVSDLYGTWRGGQRTLVGILPGTPVLLRVCVWDGRLGQTIEEAIANKAFWSCGPTFPYTPPAHGSPAEAYYMLNFTNFISPCSAEGQGPTIILTQPVDQTAYIGESVTFSVSATNHCLFQWRHEGTNVTGARSPGLRLNNVQPSQAGEYHVFVTHASGSGGVFSEVARLTVLSRPPEISSARHSNGAFAFHVSEDTGGAVVIETAPDLNPGTTWTPVFTNTAPFSFTNSTPAERQRFYRTVVP